MDGDNNKGDDVNMFKDTRSPAEKLGSENMILQPLLSYMTFDDLLNARLVSQTWNNETAWLIRTKNTSLPVNTDLDLTEFMEADRHLFQSVTLCVNNIAPNLLANFTTRGLEGIELKGISPELEEWYDEVHNAHLVYWTWERDWSVKSKFLTMLTKCITLTSISLNTLFPVLVTEAEMALLPNFFPTLRSLKLVYHFSLQPRFEQNDLGVILSQRSPNLQNLELQYTQVEIPQFRRHRLRQVINGELDHTYRGFVRFLPFFFNGRQTQGYSNPTISVKPVFILNLGDAESVTVLANLDVHFEFMQLRVWDVARERNQAGAFFAALGPFIEKSAATLRNLELEIDRYFLGGNNRIELLIPPLLHLDSLKIGSSYPPNFNFIRLPSAPNDLPSLKTITLESEGQLNIFRGYAMPSVEKIIFQFHGRPLQGHFLEKLFPSLKSVEFLPDHPDNKEFLTYMLTKLTCIHEVKIHLPHFFQEYMGLPYNPHRLYFDAWDVLTGKADPPAYVVPPLFTPPRDENNADEDTDSDDEDEDEEMEEGNDGGHEANRDEDGAAAVPEVFPSLGNLINLRKVEILNVTLREVQALVFMTDKMPKLQGLLLRTRDTRLIHMLTHTPLKEYMDTLKSYHSHVEISYFLTMNMV